MKSIRELLTGRAPLTVLGSTSTLDAARLMREEHVGCLMIVDAARSPLGIFTERDLMARVIVEGRDPAQLRLSTVRAQRVAALPSSRRSRTLRLPEGVLFLRFLAPAGQ